MIWLMSGGSFAKKQECFKAFGEEVKRYDSEVVDVLVFPTEM